MNSWRVGLVYCSGHKLGEMAEYVVAKWDLSLQPLLGLSGRWLFVVHGLGPCALVIGISSFSYTIVRWDAAGRLAA